MMIQPGLLLAGRYRLDERIAAGGMGEVWQGTDLVLDRLVAVKLMRAEYAQDEEGLARFRGEAQHAGALSHPNIARVYDYSEGDESGQPYLVMELVDGPSLAGLLDEGALGTVRTLGVVIEAARGLQAAHAAGLIHRDIKPGNLLITRSGEVKITDFGIAHAAGSAPVTRTGAMIGTPAYLAPERAAGAQVTPAADLYSLGVVAYHCLSGQVPFEGEPLAVVLAHQDQEPPPLPASVPAEAAALVADLTAKDPQQRPASAGEVAQRAEQLLAALTGLSAARLGPEEIGSAVAGLPVLSPATPPDGVGYPGTRPSEVPAGRRPWLTARAGLVLAGIAAVGVLGWAVAALPGSGPAQRQSSRPQVSQQAGSQRHAGPARSHDPYTVGDTAPASPLASAPASHHPSPAPSSAPPTTSPSPTGAPAPSPGPPSPTGTPVPSPTLPSPTGTPTPSPSPS